MQINKNQVANFILKTYQILANNDYCKIIQWSTNGKEFAIKDIEQFQENILPKYFRHRNINSFIRQLNMYGFHKSRKQPTKNIFSHPNFQRSQPDILHLVRRRIKNQQGNLQTVQCQKVNHTKDLKQLSQNYIEQSNCKIETIISIKQLKNFSSFNSLPFRQFSLQKQFSPLKSLISKSLIMDINPQLYMLMRDQYIQQEIQHDDDDLLSIADEIDKERKVCENRMSGISILHTYNFINQCQF